MSMYIELCTYTPLRLYIHIKKHLYAVPLQELEQEFPAKLRRAVAEKKARDY